MPFYISPDRVVLYSNRMPVLLLTGLLLALATNCWAQLADSVRVDELLIVGNKITKEQIILRELGFRKGDRLPAADLETFFQQETAKLRNTNLFVTEEIRFYPISPEAIGVVIMLKERWYTFPLPIIALSDRSFNEWWFNQGRDLRRLEYGFRFKRRNFRGRKEDLNLLAQFGFTKRLGLIYRIPFLDKKQSWGLTIRTSYDANRTVIANTVDHRLQNLRGEENLRRRFLWSTVLTKRIGFYDFHNFEARYVSTRISDTLAQFNPRYLLDGRTRQRYLELSYFFVHDRRDYVAYPLLGNYCRASATKTGLGFEGDVNQGDLELVAAKYVALGKKWYWETLLTGKASWPARQPYNLQRGFGYFYNNVRGFDLNVIEGQHFGIIKNTLRFKALDVNWDIASLMPIDQFSTVPLKVFFKTYFDVGHVRNPVPQPFNLRLTNQNLWGTGFGMDITTFYNSMYRFEYSFNSVGGSGFYMSFTAEL